MPEKTFHSLLEGNRRFVESKFMLDESETRRIKVAKRQQPFATILGCVDARVPPELIFDQDLGELFVVRTAGEVLDRAVLGSLEYGLVELGIPLIMVLGHKDCGAVKAAKHALRNHERAKADIQFLINKLTPVIETCVLDDDEQVEQAVRAQIVYDVKVLKQTALFKKAILRNALKIVGGMYDLHTGLVEVIIE
jgi:carbonic anhydrase